jgi:two-component system nitrate/nitrite response regulator NarL
VRASRRILVADANSFTRALLTSILSGHGVDVVGEVASCEELVATVGRLEIDAVLSNVTLEDGPLEGVLSMLVDRGVPVLAISEDPSPERVTAVLAAGAAGYLLYDVAPEHLVDAVLAVAGGAVALHPIAAATVMRQWRRFRATHTNGNKRSALTPREIEILAGMVAGLPTKAIARELGVALKTVENHKTRIFDKLDVRSHAQAVSLAITQGLLVDALPPRANGSTLDS